MLRNSDQDDRLDSSYIESAIFGLWKISIVGLIKTKASITKNFHIPPSEIDGMMMWEFELFIEALNDQIKEDNERDEAETSKYDVSKYQKMAQNPSKMMPKMPNMNLTTPKFK